MVISQNSDEKFKEISKSTVTIVVDGKMGSGFIFENGKVLTNLHVIESSSQGFVIINDTREKFDIKGYSMVDDKYDLALLSVPKLTEKPLIIASNKPKQGDELFLIDNRLNSKNFTLNGFLDYDSNPFGTGIIKTSIPADLGNSGAAILNSNGEVVAILFSGINTEIADYNAGFGYNLAVLNEIKLISNTTIIPLNNSKKAHYYNSKGLEKIAQNNFSGAIIDFDTSISINSKLFESYLNRGIAKMKLRQANAAIKDFDKALKLIPNFSLINYYKGLCLMRLKDFDGAISQFDKSLAIDDKFATAYSTRGLAKGSNKNMKGAILDCDKAIELDASNKQFYFNRGGMKLFSNDKNGGCEDLAKAKELGSSNAQTLIDKFCN